MNDISIKRRLLGWLSLVAIGAPLLPVAAMARRFLGAPGSIRVERKVVVGTLDEVTQGITVFREHGIALVKDGGGLSAISLACTHLGCTVGQAGDGFACPCHGSRFRRDGTVVNGPATTSLAAHDLQVVEGRRIVVDLGTTVEAGMKFQA